MYATPRATCILAMIPRSAELTVFLGNACHDVTGCSYTKICEISANFRPILILVQRQTRYGCCRCLIAGPRMMNKALCQGCPHTSGAQSWKIRQHRAMVTALKTNSSPLHTRSEQSQSRARHCVVVLSSSAYAHLCDFKV